MKIRWIDSTEPNSLAARVTTFDLSDGTTVYLLGDALTGTSTHLLLDNIAKWCSDNKCGRRISYDIFKFKNKKQMTLFLLKWA
jgi:hypothetical protein